MTMAELAENLRSFWTDLDRRGRAAVLGGAALVLVIAAVFAVWALQRDYQVLFKDLAQRDAAAVVAELKRLKVPYRIDADGSTLRVPADTVHETRLALMGRGVPLSGGVGFELFDNHDLSTTEYTQRINYQRALQGELARTIMSIEGVKLVRVHLVLPESSIFKRDKSRPKASVSVVLAPGGSLTENQILGVQRLVAASTPGLEPGMVTVADQRGVTLSYVSDGVPDAMAGGHLRMKKEVEDYLTRKVTEVLDRSFGPGQAIVSIDVALNFDEIRRTTQDVIPAGSSGRDPTGVMVHKREVVQRQSRPSTLRTVDGEASNGRREDGQFNSTLETNYEVSRRVEQVVTSPGSVQRVSVGVVLPRAVGKDLAARIESLVSMAAGLDERRGDAIVVQTLDQILSSESRSPASSPEGSPGPDIVSKRAAATPGPGPFDFAGTWQTWGPLVGTAVFGLILGLTLAFMLRKGSRARTGGAGKEKESRRQALLTEINGWLHEEKPVRADGAKT